MLELKSLDSPCDNINEEVKMKKKILCPLLDFKTGNQDV